MTERDRRLRQFFGGNFHQDWSLDSSCWEDVVANYKKECGEVNATRIANDLRDWLRETEAKNHPIWPEFQCDYDPLPDGITDRQWVELLAAALENEV